MRPQSYDFFLRPASFSQKINLEEEKVWSRADFLLWGISGNSRAARLQTLDTPTMFPLYCTERKFF